ncbi:MAG: TRAP transporter permease [Hyphomicrobiales bacterium]
MPKRRADLSTKAIRGEDKVRRILSGIPERVFGALAFAFVVFQVLTAAVPLSSMEQRAIHVGFAVVLLLMTVRMRRDEGGYALYIDMLVGAVAVAAALNMYLRYEWFLEEPGSSEWWDLFLGGALFLIVIEMCRRTHSWILIVLMLALLAYAMLGQHISGSFGHRGFGMSSILQQMYQTTRGIWGSITSVSATTLAIFIIYGTYINATGAGNLFMKVACKVAGRLRGGPALVSVVSSSLVGTISGSAMANVVITGTFTIPTMKRLGYRPAFAGAVESVASTGGQIMPPIMGAGAFLMAELLSVGYNKIVAAALLPALAYYGMCASAVLFRAVKHNLKPVPKAEIPAWSEILVWGQLIPFVGSVATLIVMFSVGFSTDLAGFAAWGSLVLIYLVQDLKPSALLSRAVHLVQSTREAAVAITSIVPIILAAGIILGLMNQTGLPIKISEQIGVFAEQSIWMGMAVAAVITLILGMGLPTAGAYLLAATVIAPSIVNVGFDPVAAHLYVFYFAILSAITPPVCVAIFASLPISKAGSWETVKEALLLVPLAYFLPVFFLFAPGFLMRGTVTEVLLTGIPIIAGCAAVTGALQSGRDHHAIGSPCMLMLCAGGLLMLTAGVAPGKQLMLLVPGVVLTVAGFAMWKWLDRKQAPRDALTLQAQDQR